MKIVDKYVFREVASYAGLSLGVFLFMLMTPEVLRLSELLARENVPLPKVGTLFVSLLPGKLLWAIPLTVLASLLVGLSRVAADSEVVALEAAGVSPTRLLRPGLAFAVLGAGLTLAATAWWAPMGARTIRQLQAELSAGQASYEVQPRVFDERFPNLILYIQDADEGRARWRGVFLADLSDRDNPTLTLAESAVVQPEPAQQRLLLHLFNGHTHSYAPEQPERYSVSTFAENVMTLPLPTGTTALETKRNADLGIGALWEASLQGPQWRTARADFHRRLALPAACLVFALIALPLGLLAQRSGRAVGFVAAVLVAIGYYFVFLLGDRLAREGQLPPALGVWLANLVLLVPGVAFLQGQHTTGALRWSELSNGFLRWLTHLFARFRPASRDGHPQAPSPRTERRAAGWRLARTLDLYVVRGVLFYFLLLLAALVVLFSLFTVMEMVDDIAANKVGWPGVARFLWYLLPQAVYWMAPLAFLLGLLVELALLSKRNELVAIKGAGISLYRVVVPILLAGMGVSASLFLLDYSYLPFANQRQEMLRNQIRGRPPQTLHPARHRWILGEGSRIYYYTYFDPSERRLGQLTVLELDPATFTLRRRLYARQAYWEPELPTWVLVQGWERTFDQARAVSYVPFQVSSFPEFTEPPSYFQKELRESALMNWLELGDYIAALRQSGFDVTRLLVQWHKKFAFPLVAAIVVLIAFPFGLTTGARGAVGGLAVGIALGFSYWVLAGFFEAVGNLGLLPPLLAAWGPNLAFALTGLYLTLQIET